MTGPSPFFSDDPWHVSPASLERYAAGQASPSQLASIEAHLSGCARCRDLLTAVAPPAPGPVADRLSRVLDDIVESVDGPAPRLLERLLTRLGVRDHVARLLVATPGMQLSWLAAVMATLGLTLLVTQSGSGSDGLFLVIAPLLPLAVVAAAFGFADDTMAELTLTTPTPMSWLLLIRSVSVVAPTIALCALASSALPGHGWEQVAWLLPALALSTMAAALSTWMRPMTAAAGLTVGWFLALTLASGTTVRPLHAIRGIDRVDLFVFAPGGQLVALALTCISAVVLFRRREIIDIRSLA